MKNGNSPPKWFLDFWKQVRSIATDPVGSRQKAWDKAKRLKMSPNDVNMVLKSFKTHTDQIREARSKGIWIANHKHIEGWLSEYRWEDEDAGLSPERIEPALPKSDLRKAAALDRFLNPEGVVGSSVESPASGQVGVGRSGQQHFLVLDGQPEREN